MLERFARSAQRLEDLAHEKNAGLTNENGNPIAGYGDIVVLVNPAIEAMRLLPLLDAQASFAQRNPTLFTADQPPRLVVLSATEDWPNQNAFPFARWFSTVNENHRDIKIPLFDKSLLNLDETEMDINRHFPLAPDPNGNH